MALQLARGELNAARAERNRTRDVMVKMVEDAARGTTEIQELRCAVVNTAETY